MFGCAETGEFRTLRPETDKGTFTVQATDVPKSCMRRKNRAQGVNLLKFQRKKARLTPIHESEEIFPSEKPEIIAQREEPSPISITITSPEGESRGLSIEGSFERTDTPMLHRKSVNSRLYLDLDVFEEELENIPDQDSKVKDPEVLNILAELPPRPKCKRKVLPPSITTGTDSLKPKKKKLLKLRSKFENTLDNVGSSMTKDLRSVMKRESLKVLNEQRPKSAENGVRVIHLSDLSSANSSSVPDLPSILNKLAKSNDLKDFSQFKKQTNEIDEISRGRVISKSSMYEDSGALSTPRDDSGIKLGSTEMLSTPKVGKCLKGSDIASFYNMWDRDRKSRPFDKKDSDKMKINVYRDCLCSIRNCAKKCFNQRNNVLPPISSPSRDI